MIDADRMGRLKQWLRLLDALQALQMANIAQQPGESYDDNLARRAALKLREDDILAQLDQLSRLRETNTIGGK